MPGAFPPSPHLAQESSSTHNDGSTYLDGYESETELSNLSYSVPILGDFAANEDGLFTH